MKICGNCGCSMDDNAYFCYGCGARVASDGRTERRTITEDELPYRYKPLTPWAYVGYALLYAIPVVGWVFLIVNSTGASRNINKRNFAISYWCGLLIGAGIAATALVIAAIAGVSIFG